MVILSAILVIVCQTKPIFELEWEFDESNPYMKFERNLIKKNDWVRVTTTADIDMWRPFCRPSWLSDVGQNQYLNLNERLVEAIHIWNMEEILLKITKLEWPRTDRRTDKPKTIELRQHSFYLWYYCVCINSIISSQQYFIYVYMGLPELNQY